MAHLIETMAYAGEVPWHGLGKEVPADLSPEQMLKTADLDWTVDKVPTFIDLNGVKTATGRHALVRSSDNSILDVVTTDWNPVQNQEAFEFFDEFVHSGDMEMHTAGSLKNGQVVWALAKIKDGFELFGGDEVKGYLLFTNPHKFGQSIDIRFTPIRVVCNNTLTLALDAKAANSYKMNHRRTFDGDVAKEMLGIAKDKLQTYKEMAAFLGSKRYNDDKVKEYFATIFPGLTKEEGKMSRNAVQALDVLEKQPGAKFAEGSWWQPFNAVTFMTDHLLGRTNETRIQSAWFGPNKSLKIKALEKAVEFAEAA